MQQLIPGEDNKQSGMLRLETFRRENVVAEERFSETICSLLSGDRVLQ